METMQEPTYGFIGIGVMGYGMALNLRKKTPKSTPLIICDVNAAQKEKFLKDADGPVEVADSPREVAEKAVRCERTFTTETLERLFELSCFSVLRPPLDCLQTGPRTPTPTSYRTDQYSPHAEYHNNHASPRPTRPHRLHRSANRLPIPPPPPPAQHHHGSS